MVIAGATGFELDADTLSGSVRSEIAVTLGAASAYLAVRSHSGSVVITRK